MSHILYNPKATAPAIFIPAWLSQVSSKELTPSAKMVYGRLAQWATAEGKAHRSARQLSEEIGIPERTVEDCLKTLREKKLIGTYQVSDGGHNHFEFYNHPWMSEPINKNLCYLSNNETPSAKSADPSAKSADPSAKSAVHKIKEIKINKRKKENKKEKKKTNKPVSVFSDKQTVQNHIELTVANRKDQEPLDDDFIDQGIYYAYETNADKSFDSVNKRINIFLKKVRESKWLIPQGWKGISSQSIREEEESEQRAKQEQYKQDAQIFLGITGAVAKGEGLKSFRAMFQKLKDDVNGKDADNRRMQKQAF